MMKMISSTSNTSVNGVMLMVDITLIFGRPARDCHLKGAPL